MSTNNAEGTWFDFKIDGTPAVIRLKIRPYPLQFGIDLIQKYAVTQKRKKYKVKTFDDKSMFNEMCDYLLEGFKGLEDLDNNQPLQVNSENKKALILTQNVKSDGQNIETFIIKKALELAGLPDTVREMSAKSQQILIRKMNKRRKRHG